MLRFPVKIISPRTERGLSGKNGMHFIYFQTVTLSVADRVHIVASLHILWY